MTRKARLNDVQALLSGGAATAEALADPLFQRLASAVGALGRADAVGPADVAALIRQVLVREWHDGAIPPKLAVPETDGWPSAGLWAEFGCSCVPHGVATLWVAPRPWSPTWLGDDDVKSVAAACREEPRRRPKPVLADPVVSELVPSIRGEYASAGQQEAVRSMFIAPFGATVLVCLPTGGGKTLAIQVPALHGTPEKKLVVVIVPTVALARDQERRFRELLIDAGYEGIASRPLAYHSGLDEDDRPQLYQGLRDGSVPILFTSPEAALGALRRSLLEVARAGRLALFAVDEAHMVSQWGDSFRPEFQLVAGLRDELQRAATGAGHEPFPTLLLTATLTDEGFVTLQQAFRREGGFHVVAEPRLRQEPAIVIAAAPDADARRQRALEALRFLPRPLILYTTERAHADDWGALLRERGHRRIEVVKGGDMATQRGEEVLDSWTHRTVDIIVATSAFGLGVDQSDVRAVVHACLPESLDRYYQEVGRSGRDGRASVALLLPTSEDKPVAESLASNPSISIKRGLERWRSMLNSRKHATSADGTIVVPLDAVPPKVPYSSELNVAWNQRTLVLMSRAGLIRFACVPPPECERRQGEALDDFEARRKQAFEADALMAAVHIEDEGHAEEETWQKKVEPMRAWLREQDNRTIQRMDDLVGKGQSPASLFQAVYTVEDAGIYPPPPGYEPAVVCLEQTRCRIGERLRSVFDSFSSNGRLYVKYDIPTEFLALKRWRADLAQRALERLASEGVLEFALAKDFVDPKAVWRALAARSPLRFVCRVEGGATPETHARPRVTVLERSAAVPTIRAALELERDQHVIIFPSDAPDPFNPPRRLKDTVSSMTLEAFAGRLTK